MYIYTCWICYAAQSYLRLHKSLTLIHINQFHLRCLLARLFVSSNTHTHTHGLRITEPSKQADTPTLEHPYTDFFRGRSVALKFSLFHYYAIHIFTWCFSGLALFLLFMPFCFRFGPALCIHAYVKYTRTVLFCLISVYYLNIFESVLWKSCLHT